MEKNIKKMPIREQIYNIIKTNIIERKYMPGQRLSISSISRELNVSNSPVREAISMLERDGLVESYPNAGPSVISFSNEKLIQIAQAILSMLLGALELCLQTDRIDQLIQLLQKALKEQTEHLETESEQEYVRYSIAFEGAFIQCCANPYITRQYTEIEDLFYLTVLYDHLVYRYGSDAGSDGASSDSQLNHDRRHRKSKDTPGQTLQSIPGEAR